MNIRHEFAGPEGSGSIHGYAVLMDDGRWGSACTVTTHHGDHSKDHQLPQNGPYFANEDDAIKAGVEIGQKWVAVNFPNN